MTSKLIFAALAATALASLEGCKEDELPKKSVWPSGGISIPDEVERGMKSRVRAHGELHVTTRGKFRIGPHTLFCELPSEVGASLRASGRSGVGLVGIDNLLKSLGQEAYLDGSVRTRAVSDPGCEPNGDGIFHKGYARLGASEKTLRIAMAVWQHDTYWIGEIEKQVNLNDLSIRESQPFPKGKPHVNMVIDPAIEGISAAFVEHVDNATH